MCNMFIGGWIETKKKITFITGSKYTFHMNTKLHTLAAQLQ